MKCVDMCVLHASMNRLLVLSYSGPSEQHPGLWAHYRRTMAPGERVRYKCSSRQLWELRTISGSGPVTDHEPATPSPQRKPVLLELWLGVFRWGKLLLVIHVLSLNFYWNVSTLGKLLREWNGVDIYIYYVGFPEHLDIYHLELNSSDYKCGNCRLRLRVKNTKINC